MIDMDISSITKRFEIVNALMDVCIDQCKFDNIHISFNKYNSVLLDFLKSSNRDIECTDSACMPNNQVEWGNLLDKYGFLAVSCG